MSGALGGFDRQGENDPVPKGPVATTVCAAPALNVRDVRCMRPCLDGCDTNKTIVHARDEIGYAAVPPSYVRNALWYDHNDGMQPDARCDFST